MDFLYSLPAIIIAIVLHEWAHGFTSYLLGDSTAKTDGRLSLNPLHHIDPYGFLCLLIFHVGWAKPVHINPYMYKNRKLGTALTAFAGPLMNLCIAFISIFILGLFDKFNGNYVSDITYFLYNMFLYMAIINIGLALFNLIPIPPLDGSKILSVILPDRLYFIFMKYEKYGFLILLLFLFLGMDSIIDPLLQEIFYFMYDIVSIVLKIGYM